MTKKKIDVNEENLGNLHITDIHQFKTMMNFDEDPLIDNAHEIQEDQIEGIYI